MTLVCHVLHFESSEAIQNSIERREESEEGDSKNYYPSNSLYFETIFVVT